MVKTFVRLLLHVEPQLSFGSGRVSSQLNVGSTFEVRIPLA